MSRLARLLLARLLLALALTALPLTLACLAVASPASAAESDCNGTYYAQSSFALFEPEASLVPPPLRGTGWDCASRITDRPFGLDTGSAVEYTLVYTDVAFSTVVQIARAFEQQGWVEGFATITSIDTGTGMQNSVRYTADQLGALSSPPRFAGGRFGNAATNRDIISLSYADGVNYLTNGNSFTSPSLVVSVSLTESFAANGLTDPSVLSGLKTLGDVKVTAAGAALLGGSAVMLTLVIGYPGSLLNSVIGQYYDKVLSTLRQRRDARRKRDRRGPPVEATTSETPQKAKLFGWLFIPGVIIASVISGFVDPSFGVNAMSMRVLLTAFLSLLVFNVAAWSLVRLVMRRRYANTVATIKFRWGSLALVIVAVVIARLLQFNPGVIFGLVAGLVFATTLSKARNAAVVVLNSGFGLAVALVSWVAFSVLAPLAAQAPGNVFLVFVTEFFSAVTIEGISSLPLALLPLLALDGHKLFAHRKWWWAGSYAVGLLAFMLVLLTVPGSWGTIPGDFIRWLAIFVVFGIVAVAVWVLHVVLQRRKHRETRAGSRELSATG